MCVGAQKCGTTSIKNYLAEHPEVSSHIQPEFIYFTNDQEYRRRFEDVVREQFYPSPPHAGTKLIAKYVSMSWSEKALERLQQHNPDCQLLLLVREPVARAYSSYNMERQRTGLSRSFSELRTIIEEKRHEDPMYRSFIRHGLYIEQWRVLTRYFPPSHIQVELFENLSQSPVPLCQKLFDAIGVDSSFTPSPRVHNATTQHRSKLLAHALTAVRRHRTLINAVKRVMPYGTFRKIVDSVVKLNASRTRFESMDSNMREYLTDFYAPFNEQFAEETGVDLSLWQVPRSDAYAQGQK